MDANMKSLADNRDLKSLKYIFADSLDVDPTFVRYEEEYNYCKSILGLLESHVELTPFRQNSSQWDEAYWTKLKMDLVQNFSDRRMMHMRDVAQVLLAEKVQRIENERSSAASISTTKPEAAAPVRTSAQAPQAESLDWDPEAEQARRLQAEREALAREEREAEAKRQADRKRREQERQRLEQERIEGESDFPKKAVGIAVAAAAVAIAVLLLK